MKLKRSIQLLIALLAVYNAIAQTHIDIVSLSGQWSPDIGLLRRDFKTNQFSRQSAGINIPLIFKDSSILLFNPFFERWDIQAENIDTAKLSGPGMSISFIKPLNKKWTAILSFISKWNGSNGLKFSRAMQAGGLILMN